MECFSIRYFYITHSERMSSFDVPWVTRRSLLASWATFLISGVLSLTVFLVNVFVFHFGSPAFVDNSTIVEALVWIAQILAVNLSDIGENGAPDHACTQSPHRIILFPFYVQLVLCSTASC